jgi:hypothetical protein
MDSEGCLPPHNPYRALIFLFKFNKVTFCLVPSCKITYLCLSPEQEGRRKMENAMRVSGAPPGTAPSHLITEALRGQVTCTGPHSPLVTKVVSLSLVLNCIQTHYCVHLCPFPKAQDTCRWAGWKRKPSLYGLKDRSPISISYNMASASLLYPTSHELVFSPIISQGMALNFLFYILISLPFLVGLGLNSQASLSNGVCLRGGWAGKGISCSDGFPNSFLMAADSVLRLAYHLRHSLEDTSQKSPLAVCFCSFFVVHCSAEWVTPQNLVSHSSCLGTDMSWGPNWSLIGKCVSVDNRSNLPGIIIIPQEAQGLFKLLRAWVGVLWCVVCVCASSLLPKAKAQIVETVS